MKQAALAGALLCVLALTAVSASLAAPAGRSAPSSHRGGSVLLRRGVPARFVAQALCVHDGWHHQARPPWRRTWNVPDWIRGGTGEAGWGYRGLYRGGLQWAFSTWYRAGGHGDPAAASPAEEIYRAWIVVRRDGSWREWPQTARACGLM